MKHRVARLGGRAALAELWIAALRPHPKAFLGGFAAVVAVGTSTLVAGHLALASLHLLPAPPITATNCIDDKLLMLRRSSLADAQLIAVGSSAAWRNLDMALLSRELEVPAINAATCYLYARQTAFWADVVASHAPRLETLLVVFHSRDFRSCDPAATEVFNRRLTAAYLEGWLPEWVPYVTGFRPLYLRKEARRIMEQGPNYGLDVMADELGSSVLAGKGSMNPPLSIDPRCFAALPELRGVAARHGLGLVVATVPTKPSWAARRDPGGTVLARWRNRLRAGLTGPGILFLDGSRLAMSDEQFADPVHLLYPNHRAFTAFIANSVERSLSRRSSL